ncbi:MAG: hypothetical protein P1U87_06850 [Verrucomicrobiales bacterium]|nr:hypothetical protein [Verrucomicrobiales bacterium]
MAIEERLAHIEIAKKKLNTKIPWLADTMANDLKHAFGDRNNSEFVISPEGEVLIARSWSDPETLRTDLEGLVGKAGTLTEATTGPPVIEKESKIAEGVVPRVPRPADSQALEVTSTRPGDNPRYLKLRAEAPKSLLREGNGSLHLSFALDPIHQVHWNNLAPPMKFAITAPEGIAVSPATAEAEEVAEHEADRDPRDFLIEVNRGSSEEALLVSVTYFACDDGDTWCKSITQEFQLHWDVDRDAGRIQAAGARRGGGPGRGAGKGMPDAASIFTRMDANSDGSISRDEARGPMTERFDQIDTNEDGILKKEELEVFWKNRRSP